MSVLRLPAPWTLLSWGLLVCALMGYVRFVTVADSHGLSSGAAAQIWPAPKTAEDAERVIVAVRPSTASPRTDIASDPQLNEAAAEALAPQPDQHLR
jgi:hypothetical protein